MKKLLLILLFPLLSGSDMAEDVYICNSKNATKYHKKEFCRGLGACKKETKKVTLKEAKDLGLTLCGWED
ncbi:MAG TPA: hypothetical protein PLL09_13540 [Flavobacterium sp.]|uniref:hypothetical protein n=1 Tax=unclassified Flavobacterium TaxID=196869 RepID=UPI0025C06203|nr:MULTISPECIES: hypothetical protein [unclassified Flavobacterium]HRE78835.1 hypothetical protein [Flavobacterium sp.]